MLKTICVVLVLAACTSGTQTGSVCPPSSPPTYDNFGRQFFVSYCNGCHSQGAADRHGAPADQVFDTELEIRAHAADIDREAAKGPRATNVDMPDMTGPVQFPPTEREREWLGELLACERSPS